MENLRIVFARGCAKPTIRAQKVMEAIFIPKTYTVTPGTATLVVVGTI